MADEHSTTTEAPSSEHHGGFPPFAEGDLRLPAVLARDLLRRALHDGVEARLAAGRHDHGGAARPHHGDLAEAERHEGRRRRRGRGLREGARRRRARAQAIAAGNPRQAQRREADANRKDGGGGAPRQLAGAETSIAATKRRDGRCTRHRRRRGERDRGQADRHAPSPDAVAGAVDAAIKR